MTKTKEKTNPYYLKLKEIGKANSTLHGISSLLNWDQDTYMPAGAVEARSDQLELLAGLIHSERVSKPFANTLAKLIDIKSGKVIGKELSAAQAAALKEWRRDFIKEKALPDSFVKASAKLASQSIAVWKDAKAAKDFSKFAPYLQKTIDMCRKKAEYYGYDEHPYDALLGDFEYDISTKEVTSLFNDLRKSISGLVKEIQAVKKIDDSFLYGNFSAKKQMEFSMKLLHTVGYDLSYGRLDLSAHPFSTAMHPTDSRITTRIHTSSITSSLLAVLHEAGHSLYEMNLPSEEFGTPLGQSISLAMHESQSQFWENLIGLSKPFWQHFLPILKQTFKGQFDKVTVDKFYRGINAVEPSFIRVDADEVTYSLHVILRFELEKALIEGSMKVSEIPEAWNEKMKQYLGVTVKNDAEGCLQDIHWAMGAFGYFPAYVLGNLYGAELFTAFQKDHPDWEKLVGKGDLLFIKEWLKQTVHRYGRQYSSKEIIKRATGHKFSAAPFIKQIGHKYRSIYGIK